MYADYQQKYWQQLVRRNQGNQSKRWIRRKSNGMPRK